MKTNLLSIDQLLEKGYVMNMKHNMMKVNCLTVVVVDQNWFWHIRFGHLNFRSLSLLKKKGMVHGLPSIEPLKELCEGCLSKQTRSSFKSNIPATKALLEVVYLDMCGPLESASLGGNYYFISFVGDFSRKLWVYLIKRKGKAFEVFKRFKAMVEE
ncbi:hypothetical protein CR513_36690, partial [Mucuna pruriens]